MSWAFSQDIIPLRGLIARIRRRPLVSVGIGGSLTAAHFTARLQDSAGSMSQVQTSLEFLDSRASLRDAAAIFHTAGGRNKDVVRSLLAALEREPAVLICICASKRNKVRELAKNNSRLLLYEFQHPSKKDGFLACNSLVATCILLARAFGVWSNETAIEQALISEMHSPLPELPDLRAESWLCLHGGWANIAAVDFESKCSEAALRSVLVTDYRQFSHGRHVWLAKRPESVVFSMSDASRSSLAEATCRLFPPGTTLIHWATTASGPEAAMILLLRQLKLVAEIAKSKRIDPGRPGVSEFGARLYHLGPRQPTPRKNRAAFLAVASARKVAAGMVGIDPLDAAKGFAASFTNIEFGALVVDYDGTICPESSRFDDSLPAEQAEILNTIVKNGIVLGIATGRGGSCGEALRATIPKAAWKNVLVGYRNGAFVGRLDDLRLPPDDVPSDGPLAVAAEILASSASLGEVAAISPKVGQITVRASVAARPEVLRDLVESLLPLEIQCELRIVFSSHSIDLIPKTVTKLSVVAECTKVLSHRRQAAQSTLCIGDKGRFPGNDFELLNSPFSLSVDEVNPLPCACWNFLPPGHSPADGFCYYAKNFTFGKKSFRIECGI